MFIYYLLIVFRKDFTSMATKKKEVKTEAEVDTVVEESNALTATVDGGVNSSEDWDDAIEGSEMTLSQIPTLKLTQGLSPEVTSGDFPNIRPGMFINDVTKEVIGDTVEFRLISIWKQRIKFPPRGQGTTAIECSCATVTDNGEGDIGTTYGPCRNCNYYNFYSKEHCTTQYTLIIALNDNPHDLYRLILSKTSFKAGTQFAKALRAQVNKFVKNKPPYFAFTGILTAKKVKNEAVNATYYVSDLSVKVESDVPVMDENLKEEFTLTYGEIRELRRKQIETSIKIAKANMEERSEEAENEGDFNKISSNLAADMGLEEEKETEQIDPNKVPY